MRIICRNLKISIHLKNPIDMVKLEMEGFLLFEKKQNFGLRVSGASVTFYKHSKNILHVTGIKSKSQLISIFEFVRFSILNEVVSSQVDNSLFSFKNCSDVRPVNFASTIKQVEKEELYTCSYTPEIFPALFLKPKALLKKEGFPTILLFTSGSVVMLGGKALVKIASAIHMIENLMNK